MQLLIVTNNLADNFWEAEIKALEISTVQISLMSEIPSDREIDLIAFDVANKDELHNFLTDFNFSIPYIVLSKKKDADIAVASLDNGAQACFFIPFEEYKFRNLIDEMFARSPNQIICVSSYKGGTGVTTASVNLAYAIATEVKKKVLIIDAAGFANHVALLLNTPLKYSLADISKKERRVDRSLFESSLSWKNENLALIGFGGNVEAGLTITASFFANVIDIAKELFEYTIIQTNSCSLDENTLVAIEKSSSLLLLTTMDLLAISNTKLYLDTMKALGYPESNINIIMNRDQVQSGHLTKEFIESQMGIKFFYSLPNDWDLCAESISLGQSVIETNANSDLAKSYIDLAHILTDTKEKEKKGKEKVNFISNLQSLFNQIKS